MVWTVTFRQDTEAKGVGTLTATFSDGTYNVSLSDRCDTNSDFGGFITKAQEMLLKEQDTKSEMVAIANKIETILNGK